MMSLLLIGFSLLFIAVHTLRTSLASPLNKIPGPWYAKFTSLVLKWHEFRANRTRYIHRLHLEYGQAVRIAPDEVTFASATAVKEIYCSGGSGYDKTNFYDLFKVYGKRYNSSRIYIPAMSCTRLTPSGRTMFTTLNKDDVRWPEI
jgi:hypothetical protein